MGFNVIATESSLTESYYISKLRDSIPPNKMTTIALNSVWHTKELSNFMTYLKKNHSLKLIGFDNQENSLDTTIITKQIIEELSNCDKSIAIKYQYFLPKFIFFISKNPFFENKNYKKIGDTLLLELSILTNQLNHYNSSSIIKQHFNNLRTTLKEWIKPTLIEAMAYRDSCMAHNIEWICDSLYKNEKIILWGHNVHLSKDAHEKTYPESAGRLVNEKYGKQSYHIGLYAYSGSYGSIRVKSLKKPTNKNIEYYLHANKYNCSFYPISTSDKQSWTGKKLKTLYAHHYNEKLVLNTAFDAIIMINKVSNNTNMIEP